MNSNQKMSEAYWLSPEKEIFPVIRHVDFISANKEKFGLSEQSYINFFKKYNEKISWEGKARRELMIIAFQQGWIRCRYKINKGWTIELWEYNNSAKHNISNWVKKIYKNVNTVTYGIETEIHIVSKYLESLPEEEWLIRIDLNEITSI